MLVLALLAVVVLVALAAAGIGPLALSDPLRPRAGGRTGVAPVVVAAVGGLFLLLVLAFVFVVGARGGGGGHDEPGRPPVTAVEDVAEPEPESVTHGPDVPSSDVLGPVVAIGGDASPVGGLEPDTVLRVRVQGFEPTTTATARQCIGDVCGNVVDVQFDHDGNSSFQYLVVDDFAPPARAGRCRLDAPPCSIVVAQVDGDTSVALTTVFHDPLPPPATLRVEPSTRLEQGSTVTVSAEGLPPGEQVEIIVCDRDECIEPALVRSLRAGETGSALLTFEVAREGTACAGRAGCEVALRSDSAFVRAKPVALSFAPLPGAHYDPTRVLVGLASALVLAVVAALLVRRTDWSPVGEEAAPEIDDAEYADLDAIIAALPPEDDELVPA